MFLVILGSPCFYGNSVLQQSKNSRWPWDTIKFDIMPAIPCRIAGPQSIARACLGDQSTFTILLCYWFKHGKD